MIKRFFTGILCLILCTGCCFNRPEADNVTITFSTWGSSSEIKILKPIISDFEKTHPNIKIELMHIPQDYFKKLHLMFASNLAPDVILVNNLNLPVYKKFLIPLDDKVNKSDFFSQALDSLSVDGTIYAIPRDVSTLIIYYNKTMMRDKNIPIPKEDWSLDDLISTATALTDKNTFGISFESQMYYALPYLKYLGGNILDKNKNYCADTDEFKKAVCLYKDLAYKRHVAPTPSDTGSRTQTQLFLDKKIGMHLSGRWMVPKYRECAGFEWDVINFPNYASPCDATGWAITRASKNKDAAKEFVLFLSSKDSLTKMASLGLIVPARKDVAKSGVFLNGKPEHSIIFIKSAEKSQITNVSKDYSKIIDKLSDKIFSK